MAGILFEDIFHVKDLDRDGKKFERVSRLFCESESFKMDLILDVNTQLYPVEIGEKFRLLLASTLNEDGTADDYDYQPGASNAPSRADHFEYVMYGKVYRLESEAGSSESSTLSAFVSYGGLLMKIHGDANNLHAIQPDTYIYLLMKRLTY
ncbi:DNA-directed RNA polymerases I, II, and III subunit RPABC3 [Oopsacas minuta]|uniref:DNA-directed RNA polymerases I, II, and III subunit RPABC3 n=1 Tax=Oopsacas minuta TaxID=111878 RepID=A0AAV7KIU0_9METZ|nr:DNA-directed RNA polymerases I, II, and III subunit RPABC3 [Oopsacas minuta]